MSGRPPRYRSRLTAALPALLAALLLVCTPGCEEGVAPIVDEDRPFTLYGVLNPDADTQAVQVFAVGDRVGLTTAAPLDAAVTSTDQHTGERRPWRDSVVVFADDRVGHVYWASFRASHDHTYRIEVVRADGAAAAATVTVPPRVDFAVRAPILSGGVAVPVAIGGGAPGLRQVRLRYHVSTIPPGQTTRTARTVDVPYDTLLTQTPNGWLLSLLLSRDYLTTLNAFVRTGILPDFVTLDSLELALLVVNETWNLPVDTTGIDVLADPLAFSNVENGFGFLGAGYRTRFRWRPPDSVRTAAGFTD